MAADDRGAGCAGDTDDHDSLECSSAYGCASSPSALVRGQFLPLPSRRHAGRPRAHWGRGVMTHAVRAATRYAFAELGMHRVWAVPFAHDTASCRVLEKAGYVLEGRLRRSAIKEGVVVDQWMWAAYDDMEGFAG